MDLELGPFEIAGLKIGHAEDAGALTGCTALVCEAGARAAVDVRGGAPGTREASALDPLNLVPAIHALLLTGGSAFGLDAAGGVMAALEERGVGFPTPAGVVPIVPAAVIYDLRLGDARRRPDAAMGRAAVEGAHPSGGREGNAGAGTGATVGKVFGIEGAVKGGIGMASCRLHGSGARVGALAVVNAFGDVLDPATARIAAGARRLDGSGYADTVAVLTGLAPPREPWPTAENTTLVAVVTDAPLSKAGLGRVARMAHDGIARAVRPAHTMFDGDVVYALSPAEGPAPDDAASNLVAIAGAEVAAAAILRGVRMARAAGGVPAAADLDGAGRAR